MQCVSKVVTGFCSVSNGRVCHSMYVEVFGKYWVRASHYHSKGMGVIVMVVGKNWECEES